MILQLMNNFPLRSRIWGHVQGIAELGAGYAVSRNDVNDHECDLIIFDKEGYEVKRISVFAKHCGGIDSYQDSSGDVVAFSTTKGSLGSVEFFNASAYRSTKDIESMLPEPFVGDQGILACGCTGDYHLAIFEGEDYFIGLYEYDWSEKDWKIIHNFDLDIKEPNRSHNNLTLKRYGDDLCLVTFRSHGTLWRETLCTSYIYNLKLDTVRKVNEDNKIMSNPLFSARWGACLGEESYFFTQRNFDLSGKLQVKEVPF